MIDSHAHVAFAQFDSDREEVVRRAREANVRWIEVGTDIRTSERAVEVARQYGGPAGVAGATVGVHPSDVAAGVDWEEVRRLCAAPNVVAVGEVGIDLYHQSNLGEQIEALERFAALAKEKNLPVIFHVRDPKASSSYDQTTCAHDEMIQFLRGHRGLAGVIHTFSGTRAQAEQYLELGMYLSFSGVVTFPNAGDMAEAARIAPLERILVETDCPFLAPQLVRGKRNEPAYVRYVAEKIAALRGVPIETIERATEKNTRELFRLH